MPSRKDIKLNKYNISKQQYRELFYFCLQYNDKKKKAADLIGVHSVTGDGLPRGSGTSNTTAQQAELREKYIKDCELIEQTAIEIEPVWYQQLIKGITENRPFHNLRLMENLIMNEKEYYDKRRQFFYRLAQKKKLI